MSMLGIYIPFPLRVYKNTVPFASVVTWQYAVVPLKMKLLFFVPVTPLS